MQEFQLLDDAFKHQKYSVPGVIPKVIRWNRDESSFKPDNATFLGQSFIIHPSRKLFTKKYALLIESQAIVPAIYSLAPSVISEYEMFFTHSSQLLKQYENAKWIYPSGIWVAPEDRKIHNKTKLCSMVSSDKTMCQLHLFRINFARYCHYNKLNVDMFGTLFGKHVSIIESLKDYMFSICIENYIDELYFTEKIINCFATGTIPVYLGATNISTKFNENGIIKIDNVSDIDGLVNSLTPELYLSKMDAIKENFELALKYTCPEDYISDNYL